MSSPCYDDGFLLLRTDDVLFLSAQTLVSFYVNPRPRTATVASSSGSRDSSVEANDARVTTSQAGVFLSRDSCDRLPTEDHFYNGTQLHILGNF